jgi:hypothetical protein
MIYSNIRSIRAKQDTIASLIDILAVHSTEESNPPELLMLVETTVNNNDVRFVTKLVQLAFQFRSVMNGLCSRIAENNHFTIAIIAQMIRDKRQANLDEVVLGNNHLTHGDVEL